MEKKKTHNQNSMHAVNKQSFLFLFFFNSKAKMYFFPKVFISGIIWYLGRIYTPSEKIVLLPEIWKIQLNLFVA